MFKLLWTVAAILSIIAMGCGLAAIWLTNNQLSNDFKLTAILLGLSGFAALMLGSILSIE